MWVAVCGDSCFDSLDLVRVSVLVSRDQWKHSV